MGGDVNLSVLLTITVERPVNERINFLDSAMTRRRSSRKPTVSSQLYYHDVNIAACLRLAFDEVHGRIKTQKPIR